MASHFRPKAPAGSMASLKSESAAEPTSERDRRMDDVRGGFVLKARSDEPPVRRRSLVERSSNFKESILKGLKLRKQRSTGDIDKKGTNTSTSIRSTASSASWMSNDSAQSAVTSGSHHTDSNASFVVEDEHMDTNVTETYMGEWKNDKRSGFGISERSDGLKYEGEWYNNKKYGYGVTTLKDGTKEEGKYKNNVLITSQKKKHLFLMRSAKFRERIDAAVNAAQRASKIALQKADIAISRTATARGKGEQADIGAAHAREDSEIARIIAKQFAPDFHQPGTEIVKPPIRGLSNQHQQQLLQQTTADLTNKLNQARLKEDGGPGQNRGRGRDTSVEPRYDEPPNAYHNQQTHMNSYDTHLPDRLDRNSLINQSIDNRLDAMPSYSMQQQQTQQQHQPQHHQQQPYSNRTGDMPSSLYNTPSMAPTRHSHQNLMESHNPDPNKVLMGNNVMMNSVGGMGPSQGPQGMGPGRHSMMTEGGHTQTLSHSQSHAYAPSGGMESGHEPGGAMLRERGRDTMRRNNPMSRTNNPQNPGSYNYQQAMSDHFDHYQRAPSRDSSTDRYNSRTRSRTRGATPEVGQNPQSRASSRHRTPFMDQSPSAQALPQQNPMRGSAMNMEAVMMNLERAGTPGRMSGKESPLGGGPPHFSDAGSVHSGSGPIDEMILRQRGLGQEIPPSLYTPKRTESLFLKSGLPGVPAPLFTPSKGGGGGGVGGGSVTGVPVKRKKSLPDAVTLPKSTAGMCREEIAALGSARRQEVRRQQDEAEKYRANPFLYLLNPNIKNWFSRQKLMVLVLFINLSLAILFLQLLS